MKSEMGGEIWGGIKWIGGALRPGFTYSASQRIKSGAFYTVSDAAKFREAAYNCNFILPEGTTLKAEGKGPGGWPLLKVTSEGDNQGATVHTCWKAGGTPAKAGLALAKN